MSIYQFHFVGDKGSYSNLSHKPQVEYIGNMDLCPCTVLKVTATSLKSVEEMHQTQDLHYS